MCTFTPIAHYSKVCSLLKGVKVFRPTSTLHQLKYVYLKCKSVSPHQHITVYVQCYSVKVLKYVYFHSHHQHITEWAKRAELKHLANFTAHHLQQIEKIYHLAHQNSPKEITTFIIFFRHDSIS